MCLIKSIIHKNNYSKPFIAEKDIIVYKALDHCDTFGNKCICTPYMYYPIVFVNGKCIISSVLLTNSKPYVDFGVHAFVNEEKIKSTCDFFPETKMTNIGQSFQRVVNTILDKKKILLLMNLLSLKQEKNLGNIEENINALNKFA